jgi:hypothetical protein
MGLRLFGINRKVLLTEKPFSYFIRISRKREGKEQA